MEGEDSGLREEQLRRLREALVEVKRHNAEGIPRAALARLAEAAPEGMGLTLDLRAAELLGQPVVVLRPETKEPDAEGSGEGERREDPCFATLSPREREVAGLLAAGLRNKDIAIALGIRLSTVKDHVHRILDKSGLDGRSAVAALWKK